MKEIFLLKLGEIVLKGANRFSFENKLKGNIRRRMRHFGEFDVYSTFLLGEGAFLSCDKNNYEKQYTTNYDPETSAGTDKFYTKQGKVLHPNGLSLAVDNIAQESPTAAELGNKDNYSLKFNHKNVKMGVIKTNG